MSAEVFEQRMRQELATRQVQSGVAGTVFAPAAAASSAIDALFQQREAQIQRFEAKDYLAKVNPTAADIEAYFKDPLHAAQFQTQEKADIEYIVLDLESLKKGVAVTEEELRKSYEDNLPTLYTTPEERRAAHILIKAPKEMAAGDRAKAKSQADALLAELVKKPTSFADLARKNSQDVGSASQGGDVDLFIARRDTDKAYEDALFAMAKVGDLSPVVETKEGYYILQLKAVRGGEKRSFESVRADIEQQLKKEKAQIKYSAAVTEFSNLVEQSDDFKSVADKLKLEVRSAKGVTRTPAPDAAGPLASAKFLEAVFSLESLRSKRNLEVMETAANTQVSARVLSYSPVATPPLAEVSAKVREKVVALQAAALARKEGEARLAALRSAPGTDLGGPVQKFSRSQANEAPRQITEAVLRAPATALPAAAGADLGDDGYAVVRVVKVVGRDPAAADPVRASGQYAQAWGAAEAQAYYASLKERFKVDISAPPATK
jgi:peptidyl-prolyl cis-trans isomerase D